MVIEISISEENQDDEVYDDTDDDEDTEATTSEDKRDVGIDNAPSKKHQQSSTDIERTSGACKLICKACKIMTKVYDYLAETPYRGRVVLGVVIFILALKLSDECYGLVLPVRDYVPFED